MNKKMLAGIVSLASVALLAACGAEQTSTQESTASSVQSSTVVESARESEAAQESAETSSGVDHGAMAHDDSGEIPEGLQPAENPTYEVGETVTLQHGHTPGMEGATAKVVGAFDTTAYEVTYQPTDGGDMVENHRWVIQEEITEAKDQEEPLASGTEVTLEAKHMEGMEGATATIDDAQTTTVYMVDYEPTDGGETVRNHQWLTEEELAPTGGQ